MSLLGAAEEIYTHLVNGDFYEDYDEACRMTGMMQRICMQLAAGQLHEGVISLADPPSSATLTASLEAIVNLARNDEHAYLFNPEFHACVEIARMCLEQP